MAQLGRGEAAVEQLRDSLARQQALGSGLLGSTFRAHFAYACLVAGRTAEGLDAVAQALALSERSLERYYVAELLRIRGDLLLQGADSAGAEASYRDALAFAERQGAIAFAIRAGTRLSGCWPPAAPSLKRTNALRRSWRGSAKAVILPTSWTPSTSSNSSGSDPRSDAFRSRSPPWRPALDNRSSIGTFEDYLPGTVRELGGIVIQEADMIDFARRFDPQPIHIDPDAAGQSVFGGLIASGWHTVGLAMRLIVDQYPLAGSQSRIARCR